MNFLKIFGITFGNKKHKYLPEATNNEANVMSNTANVTTGGITESAISNTTIFSPTDANAYKTLAMFDLNIENPKYEGAIPDATIKFYPLN